MSYTNINMKQLLASLLMILFINGFVHAAEDSEMDKEEYLPLSFANKQTILNWATELYAPVEKLVTNHNLPKEDTEKIHKVLKRLISEVDVLDAEIGVLPEVIYKTSVIQDLLPKYISHVDKYYNKILEYGFCKRDGAKMDKFFREVISDPVNGLPTIVENMFNEFEKILEHHDIDEVQTMDVVDMEQYIKTCVLKLNLRHLFYLLYSKIVLTEMKGFATMLQVYARRVSVDGKHEDYTSALTDLNGMFHNRLEGYHGTFSYIIGNVPQEIHRCQKLQPRRGIDFIELEHFSRIQILNLLKPNPPESCGSCNTKSSPIILDGLTAYNCKNVGPAINVCPAVLGSSRDYAWFEDISQNSLYGMKTVCDLPYHGITGKCPLCACSVDLNRTEPDFSHAIWRISVTEQISDIWNDMVVTGIKFVTYDNAVHLQIQQAKFSDDALSCSEPMWKKLDIMYDDGCEKAAVMKYQALNYHQKTLNLDAIRVPDGYAVTGVKFGLDENNVLELQIHGTPFDLETAKLNTANSQWYNVRESPMNYDDLALGRDEIEMIGADDPIKASGDFFQLETNKKIQFTHTDLKKDIGQTTIPFLDAQPISPEWPFPLGGVGLYFRKMNESGYVVPRLFILNLIPYLTMDVVHEESETN